MIKFENTEIVGWEAAIRGMRNPMNSWAKSDSFGNYTGKVQLGANDLNLMKSLIEAGTDHRKFMRMIEVYVDITAPLYWWKEFDTYKVGTVTNSCSTMHKIAEKEFTRDDFSHEHLTDLSLYGFMSLIKYLNELREDYNLKKSKEDWWQMIQLLPSSYNQRRTVMMSYEVLANIYKSRKDHKLDEWNANTNGFCAWIETLTYSELITGEFGQINKNNSGCKKRQKKKTEKKEVKNSGKIERSKDDTSGN